MNALIKKAKSQIGNGGRKYWEYGVGTKYVNGDVTPWCGCFVYWVVDKVGGYKYMTKKENPFYVPNINAWGKRHKLTKAVKEAKAGDIVTFSWGHVGFIYKNHGDGSYTTIEGNTGGDSRVYMRTRYANQIACIIRLKKNDTNPPASDVVKEPAPAPKKDPEPKPEKVKKPTKKKKKGTKTEKHVATYIVLPKMGLNVRAEYRIGAKIKKALPQGTKIETTKKHGSWVYCPKHQGWLCVKDKNNIYLKKV